MIEVYFHCLLEKNVASLVVSSKQSMHFVTNGHATILRGDTAYKGTSVNHVVASAPQGSTVIVAVLLLVRILPLARMAEYSV